LKGKMAAEEATKTLRSRLFAIVERKD